jgi:hypothetical protein
VLTNALNARISSDPSDWILLSEYVASLAGITTYPSFAFSRFTEPQYPTQTTALGRKNFTAFVTAVNEAPGSVEPFLHLINATLTLTRK